jgi:L-ascorbate metabolism protein UlaG (beta-lactamase superfamily)
MAEAQGQRGDQPPPPPFKPTASDTERTTAGELKITPVNHAGVMLQIGGKTIYVDPVGDYSQLPKADLLLITDIHGDHMNANTITALKKPGFVDTTVVVPPEVGKTPNMSTIMAAGARTMVNGASQTINMGEVSVGVEAVAAYNLTRGPQAGQLYHTKGRGNGYVLTLGGKRVFISGDTECVPEIKALRNIDIAFLPMNLPFTMTPAEAADCVKAFRPRVVYTYHYRDNDPATEPQAFVDALKGEAGIEVRMRNWY